MGYNQSRPERWQSGRMRRYRLRGSLRIWVEDLIGDEHIRIGCYFGGKFIKDRCLDNLTRIRCSEKFSGAD